MPGRMGKYAIPDTFCLLSSSQRPSNFGERRSKKSPDAFLIVGAVVNSAPYCLNPLEPFRVKRVRFADQAFAPWYARVASAQRPGSMPATVRSQASRCVICPFPFREPVPAASSFTLEFRHSSATLWADQVNDRRDDVRIQFTRQRVNGAHNHSPIQ